jgi:hypothetical protein
VNEQYQKNKIVFREHYSDRNMPYLDNSEYVIFIKHNPEFDFVLLTNIYHRCHPASMQATDFNVDIIKKLHENLMVSLANTDKGFRNNWYTKLVERHFAQTEKQQATELPVFNFDYASFFDLNKFLSELKKTADFLNQSLRFDISLTELWQEFIERNQGYQDYLHSRYLLEQVYQGNSAPIKPDWKIHAYMNSIISKTFDFWYGPLFEGEGYPIDTKEITNMIIDHVKTFDQQF